MSVSTWPSCVKGNARRVFPCARCSESKTESSTKSLNHEPTLRDSPPPRCFHEPVSVGKHAMVRNNIAPFSLCSAPIMVRINAGCALAYSRANVSMSSADIPHSAAARSGVHPATSAVSSAKPSVCCATKSSSHNSSRIMTCIMASINAVSVPGKG